jgi:hypothetical protein
MHTKHNAKDTDGENAKTRTLPPRAEAWNAAELELPWFFSARVCAL